MEPKKRDLLNRRDFMRLGAAGAALALAGPALRAQENIAYTKEMSSAPGMLKPFELDEATIAELQAGMASGKWSSRDLVDKYYSRIVQDGGHNLTPINAVIETNPDAHGIAEELDRERAEKGPRGPMHGIPVLIKDNIDTADKMMTTAGSLALVGSKPLKDAFIVRRLREAGAVILGKTNLSEWANLRSSQSTSGWSGRGGQTRNPYALDRNPSGSSSGSAAATAANLCAVAVGTETDGSVISPAAACSLVGIKPTVGLVSRSGIIPISHSQDTAGPMARSVADAAILLGALAGMDPADAVTSGSAGKAPSDYTKFLDPKGLQGARLGLARQFFGYNEKTDRIAESCIAEMKKLGAVIVDPADIPTVGKFDDSELEVLLYELKAGLNNYFASVGPGAPIKSLKEAIDFNEKNAAREMPYFSQEFFVKAEAKGPLTSKEYLRALNKNRDLSRKRGIDAVMDKHRLDAIVAPTQGPPWLTDPVNGDHYTGGCTSPAAVAPTQGPPWLTDPVNGDHYTGGCTSPAAVAGYPHITVPAGYVFGLPVGISFFGRAYSEPVLIRLAYAFEQAVKARKAPRFLKAASGLELGI